MQGNEPGAEEDKAAWADAAQKQDAGPASTDQRAVATLTTEEADIPMSQIRGGSKKKAILIGLSSIVLVAAAFGGAAYYLTSKARTATAAAFGELSQCLAGEPVTSPAEIPLKFRKHQVALMGLKPDERSEGGAPWPERCSTYALKVVDAAEDARLDDPGGKNLYTAANELATALKEKKGLDIDMSTLLKTTWEQAEAAEIVPAPASVPGPPKHLDPMSLVDVPDSAIVSKEHMPLASVHLPRHPSEERWIFFDRKSGAGPFTCRIEKERLACKGVPAEVAKLSHALTVVGSSDPGVPPLLFAGKRGDAGIYRGDGGGLVDKLAAQGAYARKDGVVVALGIEDGKMVLSVQEKPGAAPKRSLLEEAIKPFFESEVDYRNGYYNTMVSHGFLYVRLWDKETWSLHAFPLGAGGKLEKPIKIGALPGLVNHGQTPPPLASCRTGDGKRIVRVHQDRDDLVAFLLDGTWSQPVGGAGGIGSEMDCIGGSALFTASYLVTTCTSAGCSSASLTGAKPDASIAPRSGTHDGALVGDHVVSVWGAGTRGGIRARRAKPAEFGKSLESRVLFDDLVADGKLGDVPTITELKVFPAGDTALVLLQTRNGMAAMRIGDSGAFTPDTVIWE